MKHAKKFASLLLALVMVFALGTTAFAAGTNSITVKNAVKDQEYKLYKMLDLVVDTDLTAYSYTVNSAWADFFKAAGETTPAGKGLSYVVHLDSPDATFVKQLSSYVQDTSFQFLSVSVWYACLCHWKNPFIFANLHFLLINSKRL